MSWDTGHGMGFMQLKKQALLLMFMSEHNDGQKFYDEEADGVFMSEIWY